MESEKAPLRELIQGITGLVRGISRFAQENPKLVSGILKTVVGLVAMRGGLLVVSYLASLAVSPFLHLAKIWKMMSATRLLLQVGGMATAFPKLAGGVKIFGSALRWLDKGLVAAIGKIGGIFNFVWGKAGALLRWIGPLFVRVTGVIGNVMAACGGVIVKTVLAAGRAFLWLGRILLANPIGIALGLLALAGYMLYSNWSDVVGGAKALWSDLGDFFAGLWEDISSRAMALWDDLCSGFSGGIRVVSETLLAWSPLGVFLKIFQPVFDWFSQGMPDSFYGLGKAVVQGFIDGIASMAKPVTDVMKKIGDFLPESIQEKLGIKSPSRVFAQIGGFTMKGLEQGLSSAAAGPLSVVKNLAGTLATAGSIALAGSLPAMASPGLAAPDAMPFPAVKSLAETFAAAGSIAPVVNLPAMAAPSFTVPDTGPLSAVKSLAETLTVAGSVAPVVNLPVMAAPSFAVPDTGPFSAVKSLAETFSAAGSVAPVVNLPVMASPNFAAPDAGPLSAVKSLAETLTVAGSVAPVVNLPAMASPNFAAPDAGPLSAVKSLAETLAVSGSVAPVMNLPAIAAPSFAVPDTGPFSAVKSLVETLAITGSVAPVMNLPVMASPNFAAPDTGPLSAVKSLVETFAAAGSVTPVVNLPVMASLNLTAPAGTGGASGGMANATITVNVYPSPGMDEKALAELVAQKIAESQRRAAASRRSLLTDSD
jgi:hypothetical protein